MANTTDARSHHKPSHEAQVKGGEHSHQSNAGASSHKEEDGRTHNKPSHAENSPFALDVTQLHTFSRSL